MVAAHVDVIGRRGPGLKGRARDDDELAMARRLLLPAAVLAVFAAVLVIVLLATSSGRKPHAPAQPGPRRAASARPQLLRAATFMTPYPGGYELTVRHGPLGAVRYELSSSGVHENAVEIPPAGTVAVTIDETPIVLFKRLHLAGALPDDAAAGQTLLQLMPNFVGTPATAKHVAHVLRVRATKLAGRPAAEEAYAYSYEGRENVQVDVLSRRRGQVVNIELDAEPALAAASRSALEAITGGWRWR
jgi:hypothetical protein